MFIQWQPFSRPQCFEIITVYFTIKAQTGWNMSKLLPSCKQQKLSWASCDYEAYKCNMASTEPIHRNKSSITYWLTECITLKIYVAVLKDSTSKMDSFQYFLMLKWDFET